MSDNTRRSGKVPHDFDKIARKLIAVEDALKRLRDAAECMVAGEDEDSDVIHTLAPAIKQANLALAR